MSLDNNKNNPRQMWKVLNELLKDNSKNLQKQIRYGDKIIKDAKDMANEFNRYFINSVKLMMNNQRINYVGEIKYTECIFDCI